MTSMGEDIIQSNVVEQHLPIQNDWLSEPMQAHSDDAGEISMATLQTADGNSGSLGALPDNEEPTSGTAFSLPPVDKGINAIIILVCGFFVEGKLIVGGTHGWQITAFQHIDLIF
jgi:hypothetical protein